MNFEWNDDPGGSKKSSKPRKPEPSPDPETAPKRDEPTPHPYPSEPDRE
jgi:hypothetical protein